jgi:hypothetical protein
MKINRFFLLVLTSVILVSCGGDNSGSQANFESGNMGTKFAGDGQIAAISNSAVPEIDRKIIKTADISFTTDDLNNTRQRIDASVKKNEAWISSENETTSGRTTSRTLSIRVPSEKLDLLIEEISIGVKHFDSKNISSNDVTEEFVDVEARLNTRKALEARYLELLAKAGTMSDILLIENQINTLRAEIESIEGRMKYLSNQVTYSTLNLNYSTTIPVQEHLGEKLIKGLKNGWTMVLYLIIILPNLWPLLLLAIAIAFIIQRYQRKRNKSR